MNDDYKNMLLTTNLLNDFINKKYSEVGFCNTDDRIINKIISTLSIDQKSISCQRRYCLGIITRSET